MKYLKYFEAVTDRFLYHFTDKIEDILTNNRINMSSHLGTNADKSDKFFFLSLSRSPDPFAGYGRLGGNTGYSRIVFNLDKLKQNFKIVSFDYWQQKNIETLPSFQQKQPLKDISREINMRNEFEERLVSDKPYIDNISKYIERIELIYDTEYTHINKNNKIYREIQLCKKLGIKVYVYKNKKDMMYAKNNIVDEIKLQETDEEIVDYYKNEDRFRHYEELIALFVYDDKYHENYDLFKEDLEKYLKKYKLDTLGLKLDPYKIYDKIRSLYYNKKDIITSIEYDFHNYFKGGHNGVLRNIISIFIKQMKQLNVSTIKELANLKVDGLRTENQKRKDWNNIYSLEKLEWDYDSQSYLYKKLNKNELYKDNKIYFGTYKYGGYLLEEDWDKVFAIEQNNGTIGDLLNFFFNKFIDKKAIELIEKSSYDVVSKRNEYQIVKN